MRDLDVRDPTKGRGPELNGLVIRHRRPGAENA